MKKLIHFSFLFLQVTFKEVFSTTPRGVMTYARLTEKFMKIFLLVICEHRLCITQGNEKVFLVIFIFIGPKFYFLVLLVYVFLIFCAPFVLGLNSEMTQI